MEDKIINALLSYMREHGGLWRDWYAGIASDPRSRLFNDHNVSEIAGIWILRDADTASMARAIEQRFLDLGCDGGSGGGTSLSRFVYAYKKTTYTNENA